MGSVNVRVKDKIRQLTWKPKMGCVS